MKEIEKQKGNNLVLQGSILALASLLVRVIGFFYRIPLTNMLTDEGVGYYSNSYVIYMFFLMISSYGFPAAISKLTAAMLAEKKYKEAHTLFKSGLFLSLVLGVGFACIMWFWSDALANYIGTPKSTYAIQALAPALLIFSVMSVIRGYFQGMNTMVPTALSQIVEQIFNAAFSLIMAGIFIKKGLEYGAAGGTLGTGIGALSGLLFLILIYRFSKEYILRRVKKDQSKGMANSMPYYWKVIIFTSIPMIIGTVIINFTGLVDMVMIQKALLIKGFTSTDTATMYGIYEMKHKILITLPVTIAAALATASIPSITTSIVQKNKIEVRKKIDMALRFTLIIVVPAAVGEFVLAEPIIHLLFGTDHIEIAARLLKMGSISIIFFGLSTISIGILQGLGKLRVQAYTSGIALLIKVIFNFFLLYLFNFNIYGAVAANVIFALISSFLNLYVIHKYISINLDTQKTLVIPLFSSIVMGVLCFVIYLVTMGITHSNLAATMFSIVVGGIAYFLTLLKLKGITEQEVKFLPKGNAICIQLKKLRLMD